ncbi:AAA family ATPase [Acidithiobacillus sp. MC6.1]|nr:AAA family ATPase [Acidithiobacillus sp. MC6.1]
MAAVLKEKPGIGSQVFGGSHLTPKQRECIGFLEACRNERACWAVTVSGYAGTGKTTTMAAYVRMLTEMGLKVAVSAPTNKATSVLMSKIGEMEGLNYGSIHSFLGMQMTENEDGTQKCERKRDPRLSGFDVVIIDECSMIPNSMYQEIIAARKNTFVVFVGDPYQLPPVEGSEKMSPTFTETKGKEDFVLDQIIRQAADNPIIGMSMAIREAEKAGEKYTVERAIEYITACEDQRLFLVDKKHIVDLAQQRIIEHAAKGTEALSVRVVAWRNAVVERINAEVHEKIFGQTECPFSVGERVIAHSEFHATNVVKTMKYNPLKMITELMVGTIPGPKIFTSEEVVISAIERESHADHPEIDAWRIFFRRDGGGKEEYCAYTPADAQEFGTMINDRWKEWRDMRDAHRGAVQKLQLLEKQRTDQRAIDNQRYQTMQMDADARAHSKHTWWVRGDHAQIRHAYASTAHKAQGSTWHTAIIDIADLQKMPSDSDYNRALYVAVTRASDNLAIAI